MTDETAPPAPECTCPPSRTLDESYRHDPACPLYAPPARMSEEEAAGFERLLYDGGHYMADGTEYEKIMAEFRRAREAEEKWRAEVYDLLPRMDADAFTIGRLNAEIAAKDEEIKFERGARQIEHNARQVAEARADGAEAMRLSGYEYPEKEGRR